MKVLITGATGFIGNYVIEELLSCGYKVVATSSSLEKAKEKKWFKKVEYVEFDLHVRKEINLYTYFNKPDVLLHLAWGGLPNYDAIFHLENLKYHFDFIKNLVKNGLKEVVVTGTCFEYGLVNGCLEESLVTEPKNAYSIAKDTLRKYIDSLQKECEFDYKWIRLFYMYGKGQSKKSLFSLLNEAIKNNQKEFNMSGGEQLRDYLHVKDVAKNIASIIGSPAQNLIVNCCSGKPVSIRKLVETYIKEQKFEIKLNLGYYPYAKHEPMSFWGDNSKLLKIVGR